MTDREKVIKGLKCCSVDKSCLHCPWVGLDCCDRLQKAAIELLKEQQETIVSFWRTINALNKGIAEQPEQKHGHWVFDPNGMDWNIPAWKCSECHCRNDNIPASLEKTNPLQWAGSKYCPNCGAKMGEEVKQDANE